MGPRQSVFEDEANVFAFLLMMRAGFDPLKGISGLSDYIARTNYRSQTYIENFVSFHSSHDCELSVSSFLCTQKY